MSLAGEGNRRFNLHRILLIQRRIMELIARLNAAEFPGAPHAASHSDGGADEVNVTALGGFPGGGTTFLRDDGTFAAVTAGAHATSHQNGGGDEINVGGLSGVLADPQTVDTDPAGALDGDGSSGSPLEVRVDGSTIIINGSNQLEVVAAGSPGGSPDEVLEGTEYPIKFTLDGQGADISVGIKNYTALIPPAGYDGTLIAWNLYSPMTGDIVINVMKNGVSITDGNDPELAGSDEEDDVDLSDWDDQSVAGGDRLSIDVLSCSGIEFAELQMIVVRT